MKKILFIFFVVLSVSLMAKESACMQKSYLVFGKDNNHTVKSLEQIINNNPKDTRCMIKLVNLYFKNGYISKGFNLLAKAYKENPQYVKHNKINKIVHIAIYMSKLENIAKKDNNPKSWNILGLNYYKMGVFKEAIICYKNSLKIDPSQIEPRLNLAIALLRGGQKYMAIEELNEIIQRDQNNFYAYYYIGKILKYQIGDKEKAKKYFKIAKKLCKEQKNKISKKMYVLYMKDLNNETK